MARAMKEENIGMVARWWNRDVADAGCRAVVVSVTNDFRSNKNEAASLFMSLCCTIFAVWQGALSPCVTEAFCPLQEFFLPCRTAAAGSSPPAADIIKRKRFCLSFCRKSPNFQFTEGRQPRNAHACQQSSPEGCLDMAERGVGCLFCERVFGDTTARINRMFPALFY